MDNPEERVTCPECIGIGFINYCSKHKDIFNEHNFICDECEHHLIFRNTNGDIHECELQKECTICNGIGVVHKDIYDSYIKWNEC
jgi:hypothetical protein